MKKALVLDFDDTLLDTEAFKRAMAASLGLSEAEWTAAYNAFKVDNNIFEPAAFLRGVTASEREAFYATINDIEKLLFADALPFITEALSRDYEVRILTAGEKQWQAKKVEAVAWPKGVTYQVVSHDKIPALQAMREDGFEQVIFIDDKLAHVEPAAALPGVTAYLMQRGASANNTNYDKILTELTSEIL